MSSTAEIIELEQHIIALEKYLQKSNDFIHELMFCVEFGFMSVDRDKVRDLRKKFEKFNKEMNYENNIIPSND